MTCPYRRSYFDQGAGTLPLVAECSLPDGHLPLAHKLEYVLYPAQPEPDDDRAHLAQQIISDAQELNPDFDKRVDQYDKVLAAGVGTGKLAGTSTCKQCPCGPCGLCWKASDCPCNARLDRKKLLPELPYVRRVYEKLPGPEVWHRYAQPEPTVKPKPTVHTPGDQDDLIPGCQAVNVDPAYLRMASEYRGWSRRDAKRETFPGLHRDDHLWAGVTTEAWLASMFVVRFPKPIRQRRDAGGTDIDCVAGAITLANLLGMSAWRPAREKVNDTIAGALEVLPNLRAVTRSQRTDDPADLILSKRVPDGDRVVLVLKFDAQLFKAAGWISRDEVEKWWQPRLKRYRIPQSALHPMAELAELHRRRGEGGGRVIPPDRIYLDQGDRRTGPLYDPPRPCRALTQWGGTGPPPDGVVQWHGNPVASSGPRNVAVEYLDDGSIAVISFTRRLRRTHRTHAYTEVATTTREADMTSTELVAPMAVTEPTEDELAIASETTLAEDEAVIARARDAFIGFGMALRKIRVARKYRDTHESYEDYLWVRWGLSQPYAYQIENAAMAVLALPEGIPAPQNEAQARELTKVPEADRAAVMEEAAETTDGKLTAKDIKQSAEEASAIKEAASEPSDGDPASAEVLLHAAEYVITKIDRYQASPRTITALAKGYSNPHVAIRDPDALIVEVLAGLGDQVVIDNDNVRPAEPMEHDHEDSNPPGMYWHGDFIKSLHHTGGRPPKEPTPPKPEPATRPRRTKLHTLLEEDLPQFANDAWRLFRKTKAENMPSLWDNDENRAVHEQSARLLDVMWVTGALGNSDALADRLREIANITDTEWDAPKEGREHELEAAAHKAHRMQAAVDALTAKATEAAEAYAKVQAKWAEAERLCEYTVQVVGEDGWLTLHITDDGEHQVVSEHTDWGAFDAEKADAMLAEQGFARADEWVLAEDDAVAHCRKTFHIDQPTTAADDGVAEDELNAGRSTNPPPAPEAGCRTGTVVTPLGGSWT